MRKWNIEAHEPYKISGSSQDRLFGMKWCTGKDGCCKKGEGDCDSDADCKGDLMCGQGNGFDDNCNPSLGMPAAHDCCYDPNKGSLSSTAPINEYF